MARTQDSRRFYIDQDDNQAIIRTVPVRRRDAAPEVESSPATHQFESATPEVSGRRQHHGLSSRRVSQMFRTARRRSQHPTS
jgi:hypothetical protein